MLNSLFDDNTSLGINELLSATNEISLYSAFSTLDYLLKDVRVIYLKDIDISTNSFISINAKEGDMNSIPRWLCMILNEEGLIEMQDDDQLSYIKRALNRERLSPSHITSGIDSDFYIRVNNYLNNIDSKERESLIVSLNPFIASRLQKIAKLSASSPLLPEIEEKLSLEEKLLYESFYTLASNFKKLVLKVG